MYKNLIISELNSAEKLIKKFKINKNNIKIIQKIAILIANAFKKNKKIISCGNGGSYCDAMHFSEELTGIYRKYRSPYPALTITDGGHITCTGNDLGYDKIFSRYIEAIGKNDDILLCISTSGKSENIIKAIKMANSKGMKTIALTGKNNGIISKISNIEIQVPYKKYSDRIQEIHIKIIHIIILLIEKEMEKYNFIKNT
ncbi:D-sedoheptulose 7-phosphate isomerase [Candidatus Purcelliella pentastirinorum]|nr:D-sedoheptulose 7-phosphate isomerase [Candidatus Purcelliella pentastirinorum]